MNGQQRDDQFRMAGPLDAAHSHVDRPTLRDDLFKAILSDFTVLDGVRGDKGSEAAGTQQSVNPADEECDEIAQTGRRVEPLSKGAEGVPLGRAQTAATDVRRIAENTVKPRFPVLGTLACGGFQSLENLREFEEPVEEAFAVGGGPGGGGGFALGDAFAGPVLAEFGVGAELFGVGLGQVELGDGDGEDLFEERGVGASYEGFVAGFLGGDLDGGLFGEAGDGAPVAEYGGEFLVGDGFEVEGGLVLFVVLAVGLVAFAQGGGDVLVVAGQGLEGFVGDAAVHVFAAGVADDGVAAFDVVVEEVEGFAGVVGFEPEGHFAEFDGERVEVHAVDAFADHVADGGAESDGGRLFLAGADDGEFGGDAAGGGEKDVAGTAGDVGDAEGEQRLFRVLLLELVGDEVV